ncbi:class I SAM-dependent DNA methyltransferase [Marinobacterium sp. YM272]|uniref:class I SAM-dependent DNA methyltransferase n=1 Tax=Marinobacterium sp. YM272 TaxID=3421654 RepID=UPI003D7FDF7C
MDKRDEQFWDKIARKYAASPVGDEAGFDRTLARTLALFPPHARVLELGCGTGTAALRLAEGVDTYLATDISANMISIADEKLETARQNGFNGPLSFRQATLDTVSNESARYNAVIGFNYLHLAGDLPTALDHIRSLLLPGGLFISKTPCIGDMNPLIRLVIPLMRLVGKAPSVTTFSTESLLVSLKQAGFEVIANELHGSKKSDRRPFIAARAPSGD